MREEPWACAVCSVNTKQSVLFTLFSINLTKVKCAGAVQKQLKRNLTEHTHAGSAMKRKFNLCLSVIVQPLLLLLNMPTSHSASKVAANRSFPWSPRPSRTNKPEGHFSLPTATQQRSLHKRLVLSLSRNKTRAVKFSSSSFFS